MTAESLTYGEARARVLAAVQPLPAESVPLERALGRALRRPLRAPHGLPPFRNSAMDGWAARAADLATASPRTPRELPEAGVIAAGRVWAQGLGAGEVVRIMTGAALPDGADVVVRFEDAEPVNAGGGVRVRFVRPARAGEHVRDAGGDVREGDEVLPEGRTLSPHDVALAAALGVETVQVGGTPRVAVLSTGDELLDLGAPLRPGAIRDSNLPMLSWLVSEAGCDVCAAERLPDDADRVGTRLAEMFRLADVVLTIGGVSEGDFDPVKLGIRRFGEVALWRVAMRPGRPQAFGAPGGRLYFGLPGNPASVACTFEALVRPALRLLQGHSDIDRPHLPVRMATAVESAVGRVDFVRATLTWRGTEAWAEPAGAQVSGHLAPQSRAHALVVVPASHERLGVGEIADAMILRWPEAAPTR